MMQRHPSVVPFLVHISNDAKHMERFAVRSKVMTLRPDGALAPLQLSFTHLVCCHTQQLRGGPACLWSCPLSCRQLCVGGRPVAPASCPAYQHLIERPLPPTACHLYVGNRYVKYFRNIRAIQDYLVKSGGQQHGIRSATQFT